ncbi:MAG: tyrosine-type recombinase/integrase [Phycisphaerales bacterium]
MSQSRTRIPKYRLHKASGQAVVWLDGKDHYLGVHGSPESKERYTQLLAATVCQPNAAFRLRPGRTDLTLNELFVHYWEHVRVYYQAGSHATETQRMIKLSMRYLLPLFGDTPVSAFGPLNLKAVRQAMIERDLSRRYVNQSIERIKRMFRWGAENELVPPLVLQGLLAVRGLRRGRTEARESEPVRPADESVIEGALLCMTEPVAAMVRIQLMTGMRPGELISMRPCDVDRRQTPWVFIPASHKTQHLGRERRVYLGPRAQEVLEPFLARDEHAFCFSPAESTAAMFERRHYTRSTPMNQGNRPGSNRVRVPKRPAGDAYTTDSYRRAVTRACDKAFPLPESLAQRSDESQAEWEARLGTSGLGAVAAWRSEHRFHPHQLRHNAATALARAYGIEAAQVVLGHATLSVTGIYAERDFAKAASIMKQVG